MVKYKIKFNKYEQSIFNQIESIRKIKLMSVYSYLIKYSVDCKLTISAAKLHKMYKRYHKGVSLSYFKQLLLELEEIRLILIEKSDKIRTFFVPRKPFVAQKVAEKIANEEIVESIDIAKSEEHSQELNTKSCSNTNTLTSSTPNFGETVEAKELTVVAESILKDMRIRNKVIIKNVLRKLESRNNVNRSGMFKYITKVILEKKAEFEIWVREPLKFNRLKKAKRDAQEGSFNNYGQRSYSHQEFIDMEYKLLGWN